MRVSFVVLNYNGGDLLLDCIAAAAGQSHPHCEVIVADSGSTDGSLRRAQAQDLPCPVTWLPLGTNLGYARGMNLGMAEATGDLLVPLNCDAVIARDFAERAVEVMRASPRVGAVAPLVAQVAGDGSATLDGGPLGISLTMRVVVEPDVDAARDCLKPNGSCPVLRRDALEDVRDARLSGWPFDESFVTYGEDVDLSCRLLARGWRIRYDPAVRAQHERSRSSARRTLDKQGSLRSYVLRSRIENCRRHRRGLARWAGLLAIAAEDCAGGITAMLGGDRRYVPDLLRGWRWAFAQVRRPSDPPPVLPVTLRTITVLRRTPVVLPGWVLDG